MEHAKNDMRKEMNGMDEPMDKAKMDSHSQNKEMKNMSGMMGSKSMGEMCDKMNKMPRTM